jgi:hypothetical protein
LTFNDFELALSFIKDALPSSLDLCACFKDALLIPVSLTPASSDQHSSFSSGNVKETSAK